MSSDGMVIEIEGVKKRFKTRHGGGDVLAVNDVSLSIARGDTLGIVGESGSGKSTLARIMLGLIQPDEGSVRVLGRELAGASRKDLRAWRRDMQIVFQDPLESFNPRMRIGEALAEPLLLHTDMTREAREARVRELLTLVHLDPAMASRYPQQLSGGQQQRCNVARGIATNPQVLILDEPTSALDVSVRFELLKLLVELQAATGLTYMVISHDLPTIRGICDHVGVMYGGRLLEIGTADEVLDAPKHPVTKFLLSADLPVDPDEELLELPSREEVERALEEQVVRS
jgi:ABC-type glutathione transport system ATPase component